MFLLTGKGKCGHAQDEELSPVCRKPDLDSLSLRVARLDAAVSIAARRSAEVEGIVSGAEKWLESRLEEVTSNLQDHMEARVEDLVRRLVDRMLCTEHKVPSEASAEAAVEPSSSCYAPSEVSLESDVVSASGSSSISSAAGPKPRARKIVVSKRRPSKTQVPSQNNVCLATEVAEVRASQQSAEASLIPLAAESKKRPLSKHRRKQAGSNTYPESAQVLDHPPEQARPALRRSSCCKQQSSLPEGAADDDIRRRADEDLTPTPQSLDCSAATPQEDAACALGNKGSVGEGS
jgi:hypothetical protein